MKHRQGCSNWPAQRADGRITCACGAHHWTPELLLRPTSRTTRPRTLIGRVWRRLRHG